ncbi:MAG: secretin and TonB N-terminal domain-containing protein [Archangium sp.]|nr:secretin and TonB N-terminal domain-containing protein [Archangium sp.]
MRIALVVMLALSSTVFAAAPKRISLELSNADIHSVLRLFSHVGGFNLVVSEEVTGKVTLSLRNVPWDEAFKVVVASKGLGAEQSGSIVRVASLSRLTEEAQARQRMRELEFAAKPLTVRLIPVSYASAEELAAQVRPMLSSRGSVTVDARTNTLIVRDVE